MHELQLSPVLSLEVYRDVALNPERENHINQGVDFQKIPVSQTVDSLSEDAAEQQTANAAGKQSLESAKAEFVVKNRSLRYFLGIGLVGKS